MSTLKEKPVQALIVGLLWVVSLPIIIFYRAYVFTCLWFWFVAPAFGLPTIGLALAIGLLAVKGFLTYEIKPKEKKKDEEEKTLSDLTTPLIQSYLAPTFVLGFGYIVSLYV